MSPIRRRALKVGLKALYSPMMPSFSMILGLICVILCFNEVAGRSQLVEEAPDLPSKSVEFFESFSSKSVDETLEKLQIDEGHAFIEWVLWSLHSVNKPHWRIENKSHARVFDLLNWSRQQGLLPRPIHIDKICHKGMENLQEVDHNDIRIPLKPNEWIPTSSWKNLWMSCHKKLSSKTRTASNCIDIPGLVVSSNKSNNPCNKEYRMVDGAHRMCLRKYGLALLEGELAELQSLLKASGLDDKQRQYFIDQITDKENMIDKVSHAMVFEMDQETFESMLIYSDNHMRHHQRWAMTFELSQELKDEWKLWMRRVIEYVHDQKDRQIHKTDGKKNDEL